MAKPEGRHYLLPSVSVDTLLGILISPIPQTEMQALLLSLYLWASVIPLIFDWFASVDRIRRTDARAPRIRLHLHDRRLGEGLNSLACPIACWPSAALGNDVKVFTKYCPHLSPKVSASTPPRTLSIPLPLRFLHDDANASRSQCVLSKGGYRTMLPRWEDEGEHAAGQDLLQLGNGGLHTGFRMCSNAEHEHCTLVPGERTRLDANARSCRVSLGTRHHRGKRG